MTQHTNSCISVQTVSKACALGATGPFCGSCVPGYYLEDKTQLCEMCTLTLYIDLVLSLIVGYILSRFIQTEGHIANPKWMERYCIDSNWCALCFSLILHLARAGSESSLHLTSLCGAKSWAPSTILSRAKRRFCGAQCRSRPRSHRVST